MVDGLLKKIVAYKFWILVLGLVVATILCGGMYVYAIISVVNSNAPYGFAYYLCFAGIVYSNYLAPIILIAALVLNWPIGRKQLAQKLVTVGLLITLTFAALLALTVAVALNLSR